MSAFHDPALDWLSRSRLVPVIVLDDAAHAEQLADALLAGGIDCAEITFRTAAGPGALATLADRNDLLVGAGTVVTPDQVDVAVDSGAKFIVSPGLGLDVVERAQHHGVAVLPGVATASEVQAAASAGLAAVKLFPADHLGGLSMLDSLAGPFPTMRFMPSGGITAANAADYLVHPSVFAVGASWTAPRAMIQAGDFEIITQLCRRAIDSLAVPDV